MDQKQIFQKMVDFQKDTFDNYFNAMTKVQEQGEKMFDMFLKNASWMPEEGKKAVNDWIDAYKKGRENLKANTDESFAKVKEFFANTPA